MKSFRDYLKEGSMKDQMHNDAERMSRQQFCSKYGDEHGEFWDDIMGDIDESSSGENRSHFIRHNIWTVMDSDEEVMQHPVEGNPFFSAKKLIRQLDDEGYEFTHVISPEGKITYSPQHDPRHLKNFPDDQVDEGAGPGIMVNGKEVDMSSLEVDGVDSRDYPDFADAYFSAGYFVDGTDMSDEELDQFQQDNGDLLYDKAYDSLHESELNLIKDRAGVNKSDVPAHQRKNSGDPDWKVSHDDLKKERERNTSGSEGLAALKKRMGMIEDGTEWA